MSRQELLLDNQLCFLVYRLDRAIAARYRPLLGELGLTYPQYLAMLVLWEKSSCGIGELCKALDLDTGTVSPLVRRMESLGLVVRERGRGGGADERSVTVSLTGAGRALEEKALHVPGAIASCLLSDYAEYAELKERFGALLSRIEGADR